MVLHILKKKLLDQKPYNLTPELCAGIKTELYLEINNLKLKLYDLAHFTKTYVPSNKRVENIKKIDLWPLNNQVPILRQVTTEP